MSFRAEWGSTEESGSSGSHFTWPKQKLWKKTNYGYFWKEKPSSSAEKNPAWKAPNDFFSISKLFAGKIIPIDTTQELIQKVPESDSVEEGEQVEASFQEKRQYERGC